MLKRKFRLVKIASLVSVLALFLPACGPSSKEVETKAIVGTWKQTEGDHDVMKFNADGTFVYLSYHDAHWSISDDHILHTWGKVPSGMPGQKDNDFDDKQRLYLKGNDLRLITEGGILPSTISDWRRQ